MRPQLPVELNQNIEWLKAQQQPCDCAYCQSARIQLADAREALDKADRAMNEALNAWRLYLDMSEDAEAAHAERGRGA